MPNYTTEGKNGWTLPAKFLGKCLGVELGAGGEAGEVVPGEEAALGEDFSLHELADARVAGVDGVGGVVVFQHVAADGGVKLAGKELAEHVVVVVSRGGDDVD